MVYNDEDIVSIFCEVKNILENSDFFVKKNKITVYLLRTFYKLWGRHIKNYNIDYNIFASEFNKNYFWKNFLKSLLFFNKNYNWIGNSILDIGCGAAPVSIAVASLVKAREKKKILLYLVDKSERQLDIARTFLNILEIDAYEYVEGIFEIKNKKYAQLVVFSYFFCEQKKDFLMLLFNNRDKFSGGFVVLDYKENIAVIKKYFTDHGDYNIESVNMNYKIPDSLFEFIHEKEVNVYGCYYRP
jgi:hypothetical protein